MTNRWTRQLLAALAFVAFGSIVACGDDAGDNGGADASGDASDASIVSCQNDSECLDNDVCNGAESCSTEGVCVAGTPLTCTASDVCHTSECNPGTGCVETLIDADADGFASVDLGSCGTDCDDSDSNRAPDLAEICDGQDNNCNPSDDDDATRWYVDCDEDGFSEGLEPSELSCDVAGPAEDHTLCSGSGSKWVTDLSETDCCLLDDRYFPGSEEFISELLTIGEVFACEDYDSNCDDTEELEIEDVNIPIDASCFSVGNSCTGPSGWSGPTAPDCGADAEFSQCLRIANVCNRLVVDDKVQGCR